MKPALYFCLLLGLILPVSADVRDWSELLEFRDRKSQIYRVKFAAQPEAGRFQIMRLPTAKWRQRENFYLKLGDTSADKQIRLDVFTAEKRSAAGATVKASELDVTYLPKQSRHVLVKGQELEIHTYFAELEVRDDSGQIFYVKEGETFSVVSERDFEFRLLSVSEEEAEILVRKKAFEEEKTFTLKKRK